MCFFNISVCYAKSGYIEKAKSALKNIKANEFQIFVNFNKAIFELLKRDQNLDNSLLFFQTTVKLLEITKECEWFILSDFKLNLSYCLLYLRDRYINFIDETELKQIEKQNLLN